MSDPFEDYKNIGSFGTSPTRRSRPGLDAKIESAPSNENVLKDYDIKEFGAAPLKGPETPEFLPDVGKAAVSGSIKGTAALAGLPGDVLAGGRWAGEYGKYYTLKAKESLGKEPQGAASEYWKQIEQERASPERDYVGYVPTSSATTKWAEENIPGAKFDPKTVTGRFVKTGFEFLPSAAIPIGQASLAARAGAAVAAGLGSEAAGLATSGTAAEPYARIAGAFVAPWAVQKTVAPLYGALTAPEKTAFSQFVDQGRRDLAAGQSAKVNAQQLSEIVARERALGVPPEQSILRASDLLADAPPDLLKKFINEPSLQRPGINAEANRMIQSYADRASQHRQWLSGSISEVTEPFTTQMVNAYRQANGLQPLQQRITPQELQAMSQQIWQARNGAAYQAAYNNAPSVWNTRLSSVLNSPQGQAAAKDAIEAMNNTMVGRGFAQRDWLIEKPIPTGRVDQRGRPIMSDRVRLELEPGLSGLPLEFWDRFQRSLRSGANDPSIGNLRRMFDQGISEYYGNSPNLFRRAQQSASRGFGEEDAFTAGTKFFDQARSMRGPQERQEFLSKFNGLTPPEKALYMSGASQSLQNVATLDNGRSLLTNMMNNSQNANLLKNILDFGRPAGAPSNFDQIKNAVEITNLINKSERASFLQGQSRFQNWYRNHPLLGNIAAGGGLDAVRFLMDLNILGNPLFGIGALGGVAYGKVKQVANDKVAVEMLKLLNTRDPATLNCLMTEINTNPSSKTAFQKLKSLADFTDKETQRMYAKAALTYAGGAAGASDARSRIGSNYARGGAIKSQRNAHIHAATESLIAAGQPKQPMPPMARGGKAKKHPAMSIPGVHIRHETHGQPIFEGEDNA